MPPIQVYGILQLPLKVTLIGCQFGRSPRKFFKLLNIYTYFPHPAPTASFTRTFFWWKQIKNLEGGLQQECTKLRMYQETGTKQAVSPSHGFKSIQMRSSPPRCPSQMPKETSRLQTFIPTLSDFHIFSISSQSTVDLSNELHVVKERIKSIKIGKADLMGSGTSSSLE